MYVIKSINNTEYERVMSGGVNPLLGFVSESHEIQKKE